MLSMICQEVMKTMKGKQATGGSGLSFANFAGIDTYSFNCSVNDYGENCVWIIDCGACDHMIYDESLLLNKKKLTTPIRVCLPDGSFKCVALVGSVRLNDKIVLNDVMLVEGFKHNLRVPVSPHLVDFSSESVILPTITPQFSNNSFQNTTDTSSIQSPITQPSVSNSVEDSSESSELVSQIPHSVLPVQSAPRRSFRPVKLSGKYKDFETTYMPHKDVTSDQSESFNVSSSKVIEPTTYNQAKKDNNRGTFLSQKKYIRDIISDAGMEDCIPTSTPLSTDLKLSTEVGQLLDTLDTYRRLVGRLLYLGIPRPDLSYFLQHLSQFMHTPRVPHLRDVFHVAKYLKGTTDVGLWYTADSDLSLMGYSDADWSGCQFSSRSLSAYTLFIGSNLVSWKTKKQRYVSKSSAESEYKSMSVTGSELEWVHGLLEDLGVKVQLPVTLYCDNISAEQLAKNPMFHEKTRLLKRDMHYVRELVENGFLLTNS
uniref:Retrovirus-related Pol polyprotein from transposon TNT 1-94-like beta-barrel domain-containing protein n=1 Tax=Chenopodium quinoa TaxID=63459 RepID=A0A803MQU8_CHEQI